MLEYLKVVSDSLLAPINLNSFAGIVLIVVLFKYLANAILRRCLPLREHPPADQSLEMRYFYHLAIIVLILPEVFVGVNRSVGICSISLSGFFPTSL